MKEITDSLKTRQIQPNDFSLLSETDKEICLAMYELVKKAWGADGNIPLVVSGVKKTMLGKVGEAKQYGVSSGILFYNGLLYSVDTKSGVTDITYPFKVQMQRSVCSPSPVYDGTLVQSINCHYRYWADVYQDTATSTREGDCFTVDELIRLDNLVTQAKITDLDAKFTQYGITVNDLKSIITVLSGRVTVLEAANATLETSIQQANSNVTQTKAALEALTARVVLLESKSA